MSTSQERFLNGLAYFTRQTRYCDLPKICKLAYLLDITHFRQTGRSVTGSEYVTSASGPTPSALDTLLRGNTPEFRRLFSFRTEGDRVTGVREVLVSHNPADLSVFTPRQAQALAHVASEYEEAFAEQIDVGLEDCGAFSKVWQKGAGLGKKIPLELTLPDHPSREVALNRIRSDRHRAFAAQSLR